MPQILVNLLVCPDGTILKSEYRHDFKSHKGSGEHSGQYSFIEGGTDYVRYANGIPITITDESPFELIRSFVTRGGRGKEGDEILTHVPLKDIDKDWLDAIIVYEETHRPDNLFLPIYKKEREYRKEI